MSVRTLILILSIASFAHAQEAQRPTPAATPAPKPQAKKSVGRSAPKTPEQWIAAYMPKVKSALAGRWAAEVTARMTEFAPGNLGVNFTLDAEGAVTAVAVTANTSNEPFAKFCEQFVRETKFAAPPPGALAEGRMQIPFTFTIY